MVTEERWRAAQNYEAGFWASAADRISAGDMPDLQWYGWRADRLLERLDALGRAEVSDGAAKVLEVGSGPVGITSFLPAATRMALDPLQSYYSKIEPLKRPRAEGVLFVEGAGERLPVPDAACDLVIIENCIDHVKDIGAVMGEIRRVLRVEGILYLTVNCRTKPGYYIHRAISSLKLDPGHPHTFTPARARRLTERFGFDILRSDRESYLSSTLSDLKGPGARGRIKALLGISEFTVSLIAVKTGQAGGGTPPPRST